MSSKKLLLPEIRPRHHKKTSSKPGRSLIRGKPTPIASINSRQRSEATGLVLVGISLFSFALLHYIQPPAIAEIIKNLTNLLGIGIYIIPTVTGLIGLQRFLERPFMNQGWRLIGTFGVLFFGLGLLGLEGGKLGAAAFQFFSIRFGIIPSKLLFFFMTLSALVFALDIVYKDILLGILIALRTLIQISLFFWELFLTLLSMTIEAVRATLDFLFAVASSINRFFQSDEDDPNLQTISNMIPLLTGPESPMPATGPDLAFISDSIHEPDMIPIPITWRESMDEGVSAHPMIPSDSKTPSPQPVPFQPEILGKSIAADSYNVQIRDISHIVHIENTPSPLPNMIENDAKQRSVSTLSLTDSEGNLPKLPLGSPIGQDKSEDSAIISEEKAQDLELPEKSSNEIRDEYTGQAEEIDEEEDEDAPVSLDDHPIDRDLKNPRSGSSEQSASPPREILLPPIDLLTVPISHDSQAPSDLADRSALLLKTLEDFGIKAQITAVVEGPAVSRFELKPAPGIKVAKITSLIDDIALALSAPAIRIEAPIPGKPALGIEIPNSKPTPVFFYDLVKNERFKSPESLLNLALGVTISGRPVFADLTDMPHLLIAGSTGSGKSVCVNTIIASILFQARADQVKMVMIDPKMVELSSYNGIPHLISPVVTDPKKASAALLWAVEEMERRYELLASCRVRKISTYNEDIARLREEFDPSMTPMPYVVIIIDELADLMMTASAEVEGSICRLAQMARAVGIHLVIATQRPSVDVLTGIIKANLPSRIAFSVASHIDSRTILDTKGAERLLGKGDMLFVPKGRSKPLRLQGAFISDNELMAITEFAKSQGKPEYVDIAPQKGEGEEEVIVPDDLNEDDDQRLLTDIENYLATQEKTSTSMLQRRFKIGYNRAARIMDLLEQKGMVSPLDGANKRRVIGKRSNP
ncbi:MAG: DUF87 domain-containing protein [Candidatus Riflebacteria bacterium]|nr:DUF87 domain-containing protein [Candidatus Riflebacteria bacterium]